MIAAANSQEKLTPQNTKRQNTEKNPQSSVKFTSDIV